MTEKISPEEQKYYDHFWEIYLTSGEKELFAEMRPGLPGKIMSLQSSLYGLLPSDPRCLMCHAPFEGLGGRLMWLTGKNRSRYHPSLCNACEGFGDQVRGGATVEVTMLFADIRGSTTLAEKIPIDDFRKLIDRFFRTASDVVTKEMGFVDKLIGDEVSGFFVTGLGGKDHATRAARAGLEILKLTGHGQDTLPWAPVGVGVHSGRAYVGVVGESIGQVDITVLGDVANTAARLASIAKTGEMVVSETLWGSTRLGVYAHERRSVRLKGKGEMLDIRVIPV